MAVAVPITTWASAYSPFFTLCLFLFSINLEWKSPRHIHKRNLGRLKWVSPIICLTYILDRVLHHVRHRLEHRYTITPEQDIFILASIVLWGVLAVVLIEVKNPPLMGFVAAWAIGASSAYFMHQHHISPQKDDHLWLLSAQRILETFQIFLFCVAALYTAKSIAKDSIGNAASSSTDKINGVIDEKKKKEENDDNEQDDNREKKAKRLRKERISQMGGWWPYLNSLRIFLPYVLPYHDRATQAWCGLMILVLFAERILNVLIPHQLATLADSLTRSWGAAGYVPIKDMFIYMILQFPISVSIEILKNIARTRILQFADRQLKTASVNHVMDLSMDYHTSKSTGQVILTLGSSTYISGLMDHVLDLIPIVSDLTIALLYLAYTIDPSVAYVVFVFMLITVYLNQKNNDWQLPFCKDYVDATLQESSTLHHILGNWYTAVIHNRTRYEKERYARVLDASLRAKRRQSAASEAFGAITSLLDHFSLFIAMYIAACRAVDGASAVNAVIFLSSYWSSVTTPMNQLLWTYQYVIKTILYSEWLHQLLQTQPMVGDKSDAQPLTITSGKVEFNNVSFSYEPDRTILDNISFSAERGQSIAIVGETGGGKSTILKLLCRFYDTTGGNVTIDGQDVRNITIESLRDCLGIVPQTASMLNETIMENLQYAKAGVTEAEIYDACKAACVHDQIMSFPQGYSSVVGEGGVRLSGGELQRIAIARVLLRQPEIAVLDEATSSVDSETEANLQSALRELGKGRTVFVVAHRLSTITGADMILLIDDGKITERGRHSELVAAGGKYARLWEMQTRGI